MTHRHELETIVDANLYMTLATADEAGRPWASPVYFAVAGYSEFFWVSSPGARHSRNIAARPQVGIVVFDSRTPVNTGGGVYMSAVAGEVTGVELDRGIGVFSKRSLEHGAGEWTRADVLAPARLRLYRATATEHYVLSSGDERIPVSVA
jgi:hypothetical protein